MGFDWNNIGEKVTSLYQEMEYHPEYNIEQFIRDLNIEKERDLNITRPTLPAAIQQKNSMCDIVHRDCLERRRSILTKLFSLTNGLHNVDTLVEFCDSPKLCFADRPLPMSCLYSQGGVMYAVIFEMITKNKVTEGVLQDVWNMLLDDADATGQTRDLLKLSLKTDPFAMVIMADADLNAAVQALIASHDTYFEVTRILVQEPIKEDLLSALRCNGYTVEVLSKLYVFRNTAEALGHSNGKDKFKAVSVWSENIIAAKKFAANAKSKTIWINAHGVVAAGLKSLIFSAVPYWRGAKCVQDSPFSGKSLSVASTKTYDLFYGGKWQEPVLRRYFSNDAGVSFAHATEQDLHNCVNAARGAFKLWSSKKISERSKIMRNLAARLKKIGEYQHADKILLYLDEVLEFATQISIVRDGEAEITSTSEPVGVVLIHTVEGSILFPDLVVAAMTGNTVIVLPNGHSSVSITPYCDLLGSCGFPPGVINCLYTSDVSDLGKNWEMSLDSIVTSLEYESPGNVYETLCMITTPKCVWLQCE